MQWGVYVVGSVFSFVYCGYGVSVWSAAAAAENPQRRWAMALPLGKRTSELGSLQPGVTETGLCPISSGVCSGYTAVNEKDCQNSRFPGGRFSVYVGFGAVGRLFGGLWRATSWAFEERFEER